VLVPEGAEALDVLVADGVLGGGEVVEARWV
jgi:hypothetical protein